MVKKTAMRFFFVCFFFIELFYFLPKEHLYYLLKEQLRVQHVEILQAELHEKPVGISLQNMTIKYNGIPVADVKHLDAIFLLLYNKLEVKDIKVSSLVSSYLPQKLSLVQAYYSILHPMEIDFSAKGVFGSLHGKYLIKEKKVMLSLKASNIMLRNYKRTLRYMKREKNGEYSYAKSF